MGDYRGLPGAFVFAFRRSDSHVFRAYVVAAAAVGAFAALVVLLGLVSWAATPGAFGQTAFLAVVGILLLLPLFAPVLVAARRHRRSATDRRTDGTLGLAGFAVVISFWLALYVSAPDPTRPTGVLAPVFVALDALPRWGWVLPPLLAIALLALAVRLTRPADGTTETSDEGEDDPPPEATIYAGSAEDGTER